MILKDQTSIDSSVKEEHEKYNIVVTSLPFSSVYSCLEIANELQRRNHNVYMAASHIYRTRILEAGIRFIEFPLGHSQLYYDELFSNLTAISQSSRANWKISVMTLSLFISLLKQETDIMSKVIEALVISMNTNRTVEYFEPFTENHRLIRRKMTLVPKLHAIVYTGLLQNAVYDLIKQNNISLILNIPSIAIGGVITKDIHIPLDSSVPFHDKNLLERIYNMACHVIVNSVWKYVTKGYEMAWIHSLKLVNTAPPFDFPSHQSALLQNTGPLYHQDMTVRNTTLPSDLTAFLSSESKPVIYVSFGTVVKLSEEQVDHIYESLKGDWKVVWALAKIPAISQVDNDSDFYFNSWIETPVILGDSRIKLFLSHCGGNGVNEALINGKPIVGIPFFGDQIIICRRIEETGVGLNLKNVLLDISSNTINSAISEVLKNESYERKAHEMSRIIKNQGGIRASADWVELFAQISDTSLLESPWDKQSFVTSYCIDVAAILIISSFLSGLWVSRLLRKKHKPKFHRKED